MNLINLTSDGHIPDDDEIPDNEISDNEVSNIVDCFTDDCTHVIKNQCSDCYEWFCAEHLDAHQPCYKCNACNGHGVHYVCRKPTTGEIDYLEGIPTNETEDCVVCDGTGLGL